ncbi:TonB-dependent receptor [Treponema primitia]|uniref:TonB-dependent receptor plug domain-containing protein n=1 Tax=Treponema primitia TaxID=88058 RepID=UPI00397FAD0D
MKNSNGALFLAILLGCFSLFPLYAQDSSLEEDFFDEDFPVMEDEGLTIVGTPETTQQMKTLAREDIEKANAADLPTLLEDLLGMGVTRYGAYGSGADVNMRGFDTERLAVLVDGVPVNSIRSGEFDFNTVDINSIERIEVTYGGSDTKYNVSGALGGVINIITVKKQKPGWNISGGISNTSVLPGRYNGQYGGVVDPQWKDLADTQNIHIAGGYGAEKYSLRGNLFGNLAGNHFLYQDNYGYARHKQGNEVWDTGASASYIRDLADLSKLILSGDVYYGDKNIPASGYTSEHAKEIDFSTRQKILLDMPRIFRDDLTMETSLGHNWGTLDYDPGTESSFHDEHVISATNRWNWYPFEALVLRLGGDYSFIYIDSTNDGTHLDHRGGLYLAGEYQLNRVFLIATSIKGATNGKQIVPVPKIGFSWKAADFFTLKNNYFRSFKFPDFDDLYWVQAGFMGNPDLKPEDGIGADLTAEFRLKDWFSLDSTLYGEWTEESIHWSNAAGSWRPENIGVGAFLGWDTGVKLNIPVSLGPIEKIGISLSYQLQISRLLNGDLKFSDGIRIPYMPMHIVSISLDIPWKTGNVLISGRFEDARFAEVKNIIKLDPYFLLNMTINQRLNNTITIFTSLRNILNTHYESFADYPMPGISVTLGMRVNFESNREKPHD